MGSNFNNTSSSAPPSNEVIKADGYSTSEDYYNSQSEGKDYTTLVQANSPFNDGWTQEFYREQLKRKTMNNYVDFVKQTTSEPSLEYGSMASRLAELEATGTNTTQLLTAALGLTAEAGEFTEVVKKIVFQGKPYNNDNVFHMKRELGDICWYLAQAFMALDTNFDEILDMNIEKLSARYPEGTFDSYYSENRQEGDL